MRLLHTSTLTFNEFFSSDTPVYAILSHRWNAAPSSETSYQEFLVARQEFPDASSVGGDAFREQYRNAHATHPGLWKIVQACALARVDVIKWIWIDTCCIDKSSSAELSEAINSMFGWYRESFFCYAFLNDVSPVAPNESVAKSAW